MSIISCSTPDCDRPVQVKVRGLCKLHYGRWYKSEGRKGVVERQAFTFVRPAFVCEACGKSNPEEEVTARSRRERKYCDKRCLNLKYSRLERARRKSAVGSRSCQVCKQDISSRKLDARFCSLFCSDVSRGARLAEPLPQTVCALEGCDVIFTPNRRGTKCCSENHGQIHWNRLSRAEGRQKNAPWNERRKANYQQRRALKLQLPADNIRPADVYERDEWVCGLCAEPVGRDVAWPDPMSPSLDHILPLSKGGHHILANVQLAHLACNVRKGANTEADAMSA